MPETLSSDAAAAVAPEPPPGAYSRGTRLARAIVIPLLAFFLALILVFYVLFHPGRVVGPSMLPTLRNGDGMLVTKGYEDARTGDIVVANVIGQDGKPDEVVKRVVALPGDTIEIRDDIAIVNGSGENRPFVRRVAGRGDSRAPIRVPPGQVYLMGDNRPVSFDSRYLGPVSLSRIQGRAVFLYMPVNRIGSLPRTP